MNGRTWMAVLAVMVVARFDAIATAEPGPRSVVIYSADADDARLEATREAIAFWNRTLVELDRPAPFLEPQIILGSPLTRMMQTYANRVSGDGWRPGAEGLDPPSQLVQMSGDVIVLLSAQRLLSFAWPIERPNRYFLGIRSDRLAPLDNPSVARNVIAHELGHTLGLMHNTQTGHLMCGSCEILVPESEAFTFLPLLPEERAQLRESQHTQPR